jgi:hypothetical protein
MSTQAQRIINKFGGVKNFSVCLADLQKKCYHRHPANIYRWTYCREEGGTDGLVPAAMWPGIKEAARMQGIILTPEDTAP